MTQNNVYQKLLEVKKSVSYLKKEAKGMQYSYTSSSQVLGSVREKMNEAGLILVPEIVGTNVREEESSGKDGRKRTTYFTELAMKMTWINADKPEDKVECQWYAQGVDIAGEKGVGKALTYAEKYFILKTFNIPTDKDDPDSFQAKTNKGKPQAEAMPDPMNGMPGDVKTQFKGQNMTKGQVKAFCELHKWDWDEISKNLKTTEKPNDTN